MDEFVELRSDTFTKPTAEMRRAMADADVGDDVWGEDPTTNALQRRCAELFGKDAGLFVPSGSMGNEVCIKAQTQPGEEIIVEETSHVVEAEVGAPALISQVMLHPLRATRGVFDLDELSAAIKSASRFFTHTALLCLENTHQGSAGAVVSLEDLRAMSKIARERDIRVHLDGARIFNASVAAGVAVREFAAEVDTLTFCFSKGLGAPIGSMVVGDEETIDRARRVRKMLGGGMRQVGVIAAAARVALDTGVDRLAEDHANAKRLAEGIAEVWPSAVDPAQVETNIVYLDTADREAASVAASLEERGIRVGAMGARRIRCVTHRDVDAAGIERAIEAFRAVGA